MAPRDASRAPWAAAAEAYAHGRVRAAERHLAGVPPPAGAAAAAALQATGAGLAAAGAAQRRRRGGDSAGVSEAAARAGVAAAAARGAWREAGVALEGVLAAEAWAVSVYNRVLCEVCGGASAAGLAFARSFVEEGMWGAVEVAEALAGLRVSVRERKRRRRAPTRLVLTSDLVSGGRGGGVWARACVACEALCVVEFEGAMRKGVRRWAEKAGKLFELGGAVAMTQQDHVAAIEIGQIGQRFGDVAAAFVAGSESGPSLKITVDSRDWKADEDLRCDNVKDDDEEEYEEEEDGDDEMDVDLNGSAADDASRSLYFDDAERVPGARGLYIAALAHASRGEWDGALSLVRPHVDSALSQHDRSVGALAPVYWPAVYLAGAVLLRRGRAGEYARASQLLDACVAAGYRSADALALAARASDGREAVDRWRRVMGMDDERPGGMWATSQAFAAAGMHTSRTALLAMLSERIESSTGDAGMSGGGRGRGGGGVSSRDVDGAVARTASRRAMDSVSLVPARSSAAEALTLDVVRIEHARALAAAGEHGKAVEVLEVFVTAFANDDDDDYDDRRNGSSEGNSFVGDAGCAVRSCGNRKHGILRDHVWALVAAGKAKQALVAADHAATLPGASSLDRAAVFLAKADALVDLDNVDGAVKAVRTAFTTADLGSVLRPDALIGPAGDAEAAGADNAGPDNDDAQQYLRGICYNNLGVLDMCRGAAASADASFAAALVALTKSGTSGRRPGRGLGGALRSADAAAFNRALAQWRCGAAASAARTWLARAAPGVGTGDGALAAARAAEVVARDSEQGQAGRVGVWGTAARVGGAHVLAALSDVQAAALTVACLEFEARAATAAARARIAARSVGTLT